MLKTFRIGGIHPAANKITAGKGLRILERPAEISIMLSQSIGAPAKAVVKVNDHVEAGQLIAEAGGFVSANIHTPYAGTVKKLDNVRDPQGIWRPAVIIAVDEEQNGIPSCERTPDQIDALSPRDIIRMVGDAGIVGAGGATFPTRVKLSIPEGKYADTVILNGAECEPYLTCDDTLMRSEAIHITEGILLIMKAVGAKHGIVGIEANKPEAFRAMTEAANGHSNIQVVKLKTKYPQGSEKQLIYACTKRVVPAGGLPVDAHVVVDNVATAFFIEQAVRTGRPVTERIVTVTGPGLSDPGDFLVPTGVSIDALIQAAGGMPEDTGKVIAGGPMMGRAVSCLTAPSTKGLSGVLVLPEKESLRGPVSPCLRCAKCVSVCPMGLEPYLLMTYCQREMDDEAREHGVLNCLECGSCSYTCPSSRPLLDFIRLSRQRLRKKK